MLRVEPHRMIGLDLLSTTLWHLKREVSSNFEPSHENGWWLDYLIMMYAALGQLSQHCVLYVRPSTTAGRPMLSGATFSSYRQT